MDIDTLTDEEFDALVDKQIANFIAYCQESLYFEDRFLYKKILKIINDDEVSLEVELSQDFDKNVVADKFFEEFVDYSFEDDNFFADYYSTTISSNKNDKKTDLVTIYQSFDEEKPVIFDLLID